ncbi:MAG: Alpha-L-Rha alpha,3-L-rhamnosyltransferase [Acidobacteria bacterium]|nr:Alpha-L-Rha alpha,3-L-rhamnosyltransferase [Acidobacteriota bacterium]
MKISIALCTYNGEKYLREQLTSYAEQTRLPDEVIVCDDGSTDASVEILNEFGRQSPFPVRLYPNEKKLGYVRNFEKAIGLCAGDIIVTSDQDDVWHIDKLKLIEEEFAKSEKIGMVYADAEVVDENLRPLGLTMWQCNNFNLKKQKQFNTGKPLDILLRDGCVLGSSMAFLGKFIDLILPIPQDIYYDHDDWAALMISAVGDIALIDTPLIKYRQHRQQTSSGVLHKPESLLVSAVKAGKRINNYDKIINQLDFAEKKLSESRYAAKDSISKIKAARKHVSARATLPKNFSSRFVKIGQELIAGRYHTYSNGLKSAAKDLLV